MDFPELLSDRLILRQIVNDDARVVLQGYSDARVNGHMSVSYHSLDEVQEQLTWYEELYNNHTGIWWGICLSSTGEMIGNGGFHLWHHTHRTAELGYWLLPEHQKKGYALEAMRAMILYGFNEMNLHRIEAIVDSGNHPSSALLKKLGFSLDGIRRECEFVNSKFVSLEIWSMLADDIERRP